MKLLKLIAIAIPGVPLVLFVLCVLLAFILALVPFGTMGFVTVKYFAWRTEKERMRLKTKVKLEEMKSNSFALT